MVLRDWHVRLEEHFRKLRENRSTIASAQPIFALEHGLDGHELIELSSAIRTHILDQPPSQNHRLAWIVYATEIGYSFAGDQYWGTFEHSTPGWILNGNRYWMRSCFLWFYEEFGGARPTGRWAEQFSIICWPITHAILPKDLQRQLARILFEIRHSFSADLFESPASLGSYIAAKSWNTNSRFQNLAGETALIGQIATALLLEGQFGSEKLLHPATLLRIGKDLDRERGSREWLRSARRIANERAQVRGLMFGHRQPISTPGSLEIAKAEVEALGIEPHIVLRPQDAQGNVWTVWLEIPDLSHLLVRFPNLRDILTGSRCIVAGSSGRPLARAGLLHGIQKKELFKWPRSDEVLLQFEHTDPLLEYLLRTECMLKPGSTWLFRIASDGLAYESRSLQVRPGECYIIINTAQSIHSSHAQSVVINCEGVHAARVELPPALDKEWEEALKSLGLSQSKKIEVWPAGLAAAAWDGEGHGEWLASEQPCLAIRSDHPIGALVVSIDESSYPPLELAPILPGEVYFVELPSLPVGLHCVRVFTRRETLAETERLGDLDVIMRIRGAQSWSPGISSRGPLSFTMDPPSPTLEELWEGKVVLSLQGPIGQAITCKVTLYEPNQETPSITLQFPPFPLPVSPQGWHQQFNRNFRERPEVQEKYDTAHSCKLEFKANDLGAFAVCCERDFKPVRWSVRSDRQGYTARLFDDSGDAAPPSVTFYDFDTPAVGTKLDFSAAYQVPANGGLYVALKNDFAASVIVPPQARTHRLEDLRFQPQINGIDRSSKAIIHLIQIAEYWWTARVSGNLLASLRQRDILLGLSGRILYTIGGRDWEMAERSLESSHNGLQRLKRAIPKGREESGLAAALAIEIGPLAHMTTRERVRRFSSLINRRLASQPVRTKVVAAGPHIVRRRPENPSDSPNWLSELALRLASDPANVGTWAGNSIQGGIDRLLGQSAIARAARFLVLSVHQHIESTPALGQLYAGWDWT